MSKQFKASEIDEMFDNGEDVREFFDLENPVVVKAKKKRFPQRKITITVPEWAVDAAEERAEFIGTTRAAVINTWIAQMAIESKRELAAM